MWWKRLLEKRTYIDWYARWTSPKWVYAWFYCNLYQRHTKEFKAQIQSVKDGSKTHRKAVLEHPYCFKCGGPKSTQEVYCSECKNKYSKGTL